MKIICLQVAIWVFYLTSSASAQYIAQGHKIKDLKLGITWLRCSVGQAWDPSIGSCTGSAVKIDQTQVEYAVFEANRQLGDTWRLPTKEELESLICEACPPPKINAEDFPNILSEAYWTQDRNALNSRMYWSVNFMTGHSYSRFFGYQELPALLVMSD